MAALWKTLDRMRGSVLLPAWDDRDLEHFVRWLHMYAIVAANAHRATASWPLLTLAVQDATAGDVTLAARWAFRGWLLLLMDSGNTLNPEEIVGDSGWAEDVVLLKRSKSPAGAPTDALRAAMQKDLSLYGAATDPTLDQIRRTLSSGWSPGAGLLLRSGERSDGPDLMKWVSRTKGDHSFQVIEPVEDLSDEEPYQVHALPCVTIADDKTLVRGDDLLRLQRHRAGLEHIPKDEQWS